MRVAEFMTPDPLTIDVTDGLDRAMGAMDENDVRHLPVLEDGQLVGVVSDRDLLAATGWLPDGFADGPESAGPGPRPRTPRTVREIMHAGPVTAEPEDSVVTVSVDLVLRGIGCVPVLRDGALVGIVTELDVLMLYGKAVRERWLSGIEDPAVETLMTRDAVTAEPETTLGEARELARSIDVRHLPVVSDGTLVGLVSDRDLRRAAGRGQPDALPLSKFYSRDPVVLRPGDPVSRATRLFCERKISSLPVVDEAGALLGILTITDALDHCMNSVRSGAPAPAARRT